MQNQSVFKEKKKLRIIGTVLLFWAVFIAMLFLCSFLVTPMAPRLWKNFTYGCISTMVAISVTFLFVKKEKSSFREIGLIFEKRTPLRFISGFIIGVFIFLLIIAGLIVFTGTLFQYQSNSFHLTSLITYFALIPLALFEEIGFRSYPFVKLNETFGLRTTQIIIALAFGSYHLIYGWSVQVAFLGPFVWAFVFGLGAAWSGGIAFPFGLHLAVNVMQNMCGFKGNENALWIIQGNNASQNKLDTAGIIIQLTIFLAAILATEYFIRRKKNYLK